MLLAGGLPARAWQLSRYRWPDGSVTVTHEGSTKGKLAEVIEAPPADSAQVEQALRLWRKRAEDRGIRIASQRGADLSAVDAEIRNGTIGLRDAKRNLESGIAPRAGEVLGTASRHTGLSPRVLAARAGTSTRTRRCPGPSG
jgi:hypothetical protein